MKNNLTLLAAIGLFTGSLRAATDPAAPPPPKPRVEVCFVLDTTGSMGGLLEGAKQKIWSIANEIAAAKPTPTVRVSLVAFRDRGDDYVVRSWPLTEDLDAVYARLSELKAEGGGDFPESVNEALAEGVGPKIEWSTDKEVLRLVFLVGDAPPHMDYRDGPKYSDVCREAVKRDLVINTVQCGGNAETTRAWQDIARLGEGCYAAIPADGGVAVVEAPQDGRLAELNRELGATLVPYGSRARQASVSRKQAVAASAPAAAAADRLSYNAKTGKTVQGEGELLDDVREGKQKLADVKREELPPDLQELEPEALRKEIERRGSERARIQTEVSRLSREREEFLKGESRRRAEATKGGKRKADDGFEEKVREMLREEGGRKRLKFGE